MRFTALGRTGWLFDAVEACVGAGHECVLVATRPASPEYTRTEDDFAALAERLGVPFLEHLPGPEHPQAEVAISMNWPTLIGGLVRERFAHGVINAHPGDVPRFRGNACPNWAIIAGETQVVLTLHEMVDELDAGPVLDKRAFPLDDDTYIADVYRWLATAVPEAFVAVLDGLERGDLRATPQEGEAVRCYPRRPEDGLLDFARPAAELARIVRASGEPFAGAFTHLDGERLTVWRARAEALGHAALGVPGQVTQRRENGDVAVLCGDGAVLVLEEVEAGGQRGAPAEAVRSPRARLG